MILTYLCRRQGVSLRLGLSMALCALSLSACVSAETTQPPVSIERRREVIERNTSVRKPARAPAAEDSITGEVPAPIMNLLIDDLMLRAVARRDAITVVQSVQRDWPDSSLGCTKPGENYMQVVTPGYRVALQANGQRYVYHADQRGRFILCDGGSPLPPVRTNSTERPVR